MHTLAAFRPLALANAVLICVLTAACRDDAECSATNRTGTYLFQAREVSGDCGYVSDTVGILTNGSPALEDGCTVDFERWSDDSCKLERAVTCISQNSNRRQTASGVTNEEDDGAKLTGTMTVIVSALDTQSVICSSTYDTTATRQ
jgi:hypothetical protein